MLEQYINDLEKYRNFNIDDNVKKFEEVLGYIARLKDPRSISKLISFFDDSSEYEEVIFGIVHLIEEFDDYTYLHELAPALPWMVKNVPYWAKILHYRILNSHTTLDEYLKLISSFSDEVKLALRKLLVLIKNEDTEFADRCNKLILKIDQ